MIVSPIEIVLDLRLWRENPKESREFASLWKKVAKACNGEVGNVGETRKVEHPQRGTLEFTIIGVPQRNTPLSPDLPIAIHSILESPVSDAHCVICAEEGIDRYGPLLCDASRALGEIVPLCEKHAVIPEGKMTPFSPHRLPQGKDGQGPAAFWCRGPLCCSSNGNEARVLWSEIQRKRLPDNPAVFYCERCFDKLYPPCSSEGCKDVAMLKCEHLLENTGQPCGRQVCDNHSITWQVYGPHGDGIVLCDLHQEIGQLSDEEILYQMVAATARRRIALSPPIRMKNRWIRKKTNKSLPELPPLQDVRHVFRLAHHSTREDTLVRQVDQIYFIANLFDSFNRKLRTKARSLLHEEMSIVIGKHVGQRKEDVRAIIAEMEKKSFNEVLDYYTERNLTHLAAAITFVHCHYVGEGKGPRMNLRVPGVYRNGLLGSQRQHLGILEQRLGMWIDIDWV